MSNSGHTGYGIKEFVCDTLDDIENLPIDVKPGSAALIISTGAIYMINSKGEWVEV
jgi:hypothetical protein